MRIIQNRPTKFHLFVCAILQYNQNNNNNSTSEQQIEFSKKDLITPIKSLTCGTFYDIEEITK